jgi:ATP-binding cassette subfamily C protein LapB
MGSIRLPIHDVAGFTWQLPLRTPMSDHHQAAHDPLLQCLAILARRFQRPVSLESLVAGLPVRPGDSSPELFSINQSKALLSRVAKRAGLTTRLIQRDLDEFSSLLLPCILVLKGRNACILDSIDREAGTAMVILPEVSDGATEFKLDVLAEQQIGFAFLVKPEYQGKPTHQRLIDVGDGHWFWGTLNRSRQIYFSVVIGSVLINLFALAAPLFTMNVYDRVVPNNAIETLWVLVIGVGTVYILDSLLRFLRNYLLEIAGKKSDVIMSSIIFEQVMNLRMEKWPDSVGAFTSKLNQFESIRSFFTASTLVTLVDLPFSIVFLVVVAFVGDALVAIPLMTAALLLLYGLILVRPLRKEVEGVMAANAVKSSLLVETLHNIQTVKTLGAARYAQWAWEESSGEIATRSVRSRLLSGSISVVTNFLVQANMVGIVVLGVYEIVDLNMSMGALIATVMLASRAISPMAQVAGLITNYQQTKTAFASIDSLLAEEVERPEGQNYVRRPALSGAVEFRDVEFTYPDASAATLKNFSLKIAPGEHVGIIGKVGSGKTTLAKNLLRLYSPQAGSVTVDDIDINQIDPADLRRGIAYLSQEIELVRGTIRENITFKDPSVDDAMIVEAARVSGVDLFVNRMPRGFDTGVGEGGARLSGGQRQCVALARTVLLDEPILILDEPTNSMDNGTETEVRRRLQEFSKDKTLILITHKAPMLDLVDRLVVVEDGAVVMDGPKEKILNALAQRAQTSAGEPEK